MIEFGIKKIKCLEVCNRDNYGHVGRVLQVDDAFINFEDLKLLAIARIERRLFDNL